MRSPDDFLYEYSVIRYVPHIHRGEFVNIGLLMLCKRKRWMYGRIFIDEERIKAFDPSCDIEFLRHQASMFERTDLPGKDLPAEEKYRWLTAAKSAVLQTSRSHPGIIVEQSAFEIDKNKRPEEILLKEFNRLFSELVMI